MTITRRWQAGFEVGNLNEFTEVVYTNGGVEITTSPKTGTYCIRNRPYDACYGSKTISATKQIRVACFAEVFGAYNLGFFVIRSASNTKLVEIEYTSAGNVIIDIAGSNVATTSSPVITPEVWQHWAVDIKIDATVGWVEVYRDGTSVLSYSGNTGSTDIAKVGFGSTAGTGTFAYPTYFDDCYVDDTTSESAAAVVPIKRFYYISPNGNGNYSQWDGSDGNSTDNYALVDEVPPVTTDYVSNYTADELDSYLMSSITLGANEEILAIIPIASVQRASTTEQIALGTRYNSTDSVGSDQSPGSSYSFLWERQTAKPGGGAWDQTSLDGVEVVIKARGTY